MNWSMAAARIAIVFSTFALMALATLHVLKPEIPPLRAMISQYALGRHGWMMALSFGAFGAASACLFVAIVGHTQSVSSRIGLVFLAGAALAFAMAACFRMDAPGTVPGQMSFSGRMHGISFLIGVPCQLFATLLLSPGFGCAMLWPLTGLVWISFIITFAIMLMVGPGKAPNPKGPERFLGLPNRLFMIGWGVWLIVAAWPRV